MLSLKSLFHKRKSNEQDSIPDMEALTVIKKDEFLSVINRDLTAETPVIPVLHHEQEQTLIEHLLGFLSKEPFHVIGMDVSQVHTTDDMTDEAYHALMNEAREHENETYVILIHGTKKCPYPNLIRAFIFVHMTIPSLPRNIRFVLMNTGAKILEQANFHPYKHYAMS